MADEYQMVDLLPQIESPREPVIIEKQMSSAFGATDPGCVRANNEDRFVVDQGAGFYLVAHGMGGAQAGERASQIAAETLVEIVHEEGSEMNAARLASAFHVANQRVKEMASTDHMLE